MNINLEKVPFSTFGSYFAISIIDYELVLKELHGGDESPSVIFKIVPVIDGKDVNYNIKATENEIIIENDTNKYCKITMADEKSIHFLLNGIDLKLIALKNRYDSLIPFELNQYEYHLYTKEIKIMFTLLKGNWNIDAPWAYVGNDKIEIDFNSKNEESLFVMESYKSIWDKKEYSDYESALLKNIASYEDFCKKNEFISEYNIESQKLALYILYSSFVHAEGMLHFPAMYMSKNYMNNIWSWDNSFNAIFLSKNFPDLSLEQLKIFIEYQDEYGIYPDLVNDKFASFNCCKPPVTGYCFKKMRENNSFFDDKNILTFVYESLKKQTNYWLLHRTKKQGELPYYNHGNDSGWDNASIFHEGLPVESPDLACYLILQMDILKDISAELNLKDESSMWENKATEVYSLLMKRLFDKEKFFAIYKPTNTKIKAQSSLILYLPILIGYRFLKDKEIDGRKLLDSLVHDLEREFETPFGLSTESIHSKLFKENGYWLGPIWAAPTYLLINGLKENGYGDFATRLLKKFEKLTDKGGMAENFNPFTGKGLSDPAFTWTSGIFLSLIREFNKKEIKYEKI